MNIKRTLSIMLLLILTVLPLGTITSFAESDIFEQETAFINEIESQKTADEKIVSNDDYINKEVLGQETVPTTNSVIKKINRKGAELIMMAQAFGKQISILFLVFALIAMAVGALGNSSLTGKSLTAAILCVIMYIAIEYAPMLGDIALNFMRS